jgi:cell division protein FtsB
LDIVNPLAYNGKMENKKKVWAWLILIVGLVLAVKTGMNVYRLWKLGGRVEDVQKQVVAAEAENKELQAKLEYVKSEDFVEKEARDKLGYGKPGEEIVVIPEQDNTQYSVLNTQGVKMPNWRKWVRLYIGI